MFALKYGVLGSTGELANDSAPTAAAVHFNKDGAPSSVREM